MGGSFAKISGVVLYTLGITSNFFHHWLLSRARKGKEYVPVTEIGGLFGTLTCPHYVAEVMEWVGFALVGRTIFHYTVASFFAIYLGGRARQTKQWYLKKGL